MTVKTRAKGGATATCQWRASASNPWQQSTSTFLPGFEALEVSEGHYWTHGHWSGGGPFLVRRDYTTFVTGSVNLPNCVGTVYLGTPTFAYSDTPKFSDPGEAGLNADGATAIARTDPTDPAASVSVALGEVLHDGLPSIPFSDWKERTRIAKKAGKNYLNVEFGWLPLVSDIKKLRSAATNSHQILSNYRRDAGTSLHRIYSFPDKIQTDVYKGTFTPRPSISSIGFLPGTLTHTSVQRKWFEGRFIYYIQAGQNVIARSQRYASYAAKLYGAELTPETVWNLAPWSWAVDWFSNTGDVIHNISSLGINGTVLQYGYMMCHTESVTESRAFLPGGAMISSSRTYETKRRVEANPYGFGVSIGSLSATQLAVMAALGLSR